MMKFLILALSVCLVACAGPKSISYDADRKKIIETNEHVRDGFVNQNVSKILKFHHPEVEKVLAWNDYQKGHADMEKGLNGVFDNYVLEFQGSAADMDSLEIFHDTAVMIAKFTINGSPKKDGFQPFEFSGRTMIVYVRDESSPTGWVTLREMIMPAK